MILDLLNFTFMINLEDLIINKFSLKKIYFTFKLCVGVCICVCVCECGYP